MPTPKLRHLILHELPSARDWQDRSEFREVSSWWKNGGLGVFMLHGIGGAGKTALAERFVSALPGVYPDHPESFPKDATFPTPQAVLVLSFYKERNADVFFAILTAWLKGEVYDPNAPRPSYATTLTALGQISEQAPLLLVLDGLEVMQEDGTRGAHGLITDLHLREFLLSVLKGTFLRKVSVLTTTRFRIYVPRPNKAPYLYPEAVEQLGEEAAFRLLRARGVLRGSRADLVLLARQLGYHALAVDLIGGFIARYCDGDPARLTQEDPRVAFGPKARKDSRRDPVADQLVSQDERFARLAGRYREALATYDAASLAVLERVCLFRVGIGEAALTAMFCGDGKAHVGGAMAGLSAEEVRERLELLADMRLVEVSGVESEKRYTTHPAVRDGFRSGFDHASEMASHEAALQQFQLSLGGRPGDSFPVDPEPLDRLEDVIFHAVSAERYDEGWALFIDRVGGFANLGWRLAQFERGERICRSFTGQPLAIRPNLPPRLSDRYQSAFYNEWGLFLTSLGRLKPAEVCFRQAIALTKQDESKAHSLLNRAEVQALAGNLVAALESAEEAVARAAESTLVPVCAASRRHLRALLGREPHEMHGVRAVLFSVQDQQAENKLRGVLSVPILFRAGLQQRAGRQWVRAFGRSSTRIHDQGVAFVLNAERALLQGDHAEAGRLLAATVEAALQADSKELRCWSAGLKARLALATAERDDAPGLVDAQQAVDDGIAVAREAGFATFHIDLLTIRAHLSLRANKFDDAERDLRTALYGLRPAAEPERAFEAEPLDDTAAPDQRGVFPLGDTNPPLLAATHPSCGYAAGEADARHLMAELYVARASASRPDGRRFLDRAAQEAARAAELRRAIGDPLLGRLMEIRTSSQSGGLDAKLTSPYLRPPPAPACPPPEPLAAQPVRPAAEPRPAGDGAIDVGVVVPLPEEFRTFLATLPVTATPASTPESKALDYLFDWPPPAGGGYRCAVVLVGGPGMIDAAVVTHDFLARRRPKSLVLLGIAAGISSDVRLGDVVVGDQVSLYLEDSKAVPVQDGYRLQLAGRDLSCDRGLVESALHFQFAHRDKFDRWIQQGRDALERLAGTEAARFRSDRLVQAEPRYHVGGIASASVVVAAAEFTALVRERNRKLLALEMEAGGLLAAALHSSHVTRPLVIRGLSDFGDERKTEFDGTAHGVFRRYAMQNAVQLLCGLLDAGVFPRSSG